ncbi:MFS transporter [Salininema proteolyticum]|uniref:MFS transporter n=1 Tax=Salininema proteolyticum TaxID=1607685 RepID=A0ABV8U5F1_9ACTN
MPSTESNPRAGLREWLGLTVLALPVFVLALDLTVLHLALPHLVEDLRPSGFQQLWILDVYGFLVAGFLVTMGGLADRIGRRRLLMIGAAAFGLASLAAAYAPNAEALIAARALLGVAGATFTPSSLALIRDLFRHPGQRGFAMAVWMACFAGGAALGPSIGGLLLENFWWGSVFLLGVVVMALLLATGPFLIPEHRTAAGGRIDLYSALLSLASLLLIVFAVKDSAKNGVGPAAAAALAAGIALGWVFVRRQRRLESPLVDVRLFRIRVFSLGLVSLLAFGLSAGALTMLFAQYLQLVEGFSPFTAGLWMLPQGLASVVASLAAPGVAGRIGRGRTVALAAGTSTLGLVVFAAAGLSGGFTAAFAGALVFAIGMGAMSAVLVDLVVNSAPEEHSGSASSIFETVGELGQAAGIAILGAAATAVYRGGVTATMPDEVPDGAASDASESLSDAAAAADGLAPEAAERLMETAREAFSGGLAATMLAAAAGLGVITVLAWRTLPNTPSGGEEPAPESESPLSTQLFVQVFA